MNKKYSRIKAINIDNGEELGNIIIKNDGSERLNLKIEKCNQIKGIKLKTEKTKEITNFIEGNEGSFIHLIYKYSYPLMDILQTKCKGNKNNIHIIRFIQLATYTTFGGRLFDKNKNEIKKSSLSKIWHTTSKNSINETYDLLIECGYIYENKDNYIMIGKDLIVKGAIEDFKKLKRLDMNLTYTRLFTQNIQDMYKGTEPKKRKQLANLFKILPYINFKYNVFCANPTELDESNLILYTWTDLARICGYEEKKNIAKFKKELWNLDIYRHNVIGEFKTKSGIAICVNPKVYYSGDNVKDIERLYVMFSMVEDRNKKR